MRRLPGRWVEFIEASEEGEVPEGFYIEEDRAKTFKSEPGWLRNRLRYVYSAARKPHARGGV